MKASERKHKAPDTLDSSNESTEQRENIDGENIYDSDSDDEGVSCRTLTRIRLMKKSTL